MERKFTPPGEINPRGLKEKNKSEKQDKRKELLSKYLDRILKEADVDDDLLESLHDYYKDLSSKDKAIILYEKLMAYQHDKKNKIEDNNDEENETLKEALKYLATEIKSLISDEDTKEIFLDKFSEAKMDDKEIRLSALAQEWKRTKSEHDEIKSEYIKLAREKFSSDEMKKSAVSVLNTKLKLLSKQLLGLEDKLKSFSSLDFENRVNENTDVIADFQYQQLIEYRHQLEKGFVWLPSRKDIHDKTIASLQNGRWPVLIGEAGTGKSEQADAAAIELTGYKPTHIQCEKNTGFEDLIEDISIDPETKGSYQEYGPMMQAFTGYDDSRQTEPSVKKGRVVRLDESGRLGAKAYSVIKEARQKKAGDDFYGHKFLPGASSIWTTNPPGSRYPDRKQPDPAMRREIAEIIVDYPECTKDNPELYEFLLACLLDDNNYTDVGKEELAPAYIKKELEEDKQIMVSKNSKAVACDELIEDGADAKHGALWRLAGAIKTLQNAFVFGNNDGSIKIPENHLYYKEDDKGDIEIAKEGGQPMLLSSSTITLGEIKSWMEGYKKRLEKADAKFHTDNLTKWINLKMSIYLEQVDKDDRQKVEAIFKHYHFLDNSQADIKSTTPITPKQIGYLSPRVPRPLHTEIVAQEIEESVESEESVVAKEYEDYEVLLENGERIKIKKEPVEVGGISLNVGDGLRNKNGEDFNFAGIYNQNDNKLPVLNFSQEKDLHKISDYEEVAECALTYFQESINNTLSSLEKSFGVFWQNYCENK